ncbi:hypothetical protein [Phyllobacterium sophorae]|uniref:Uncharacterized protein n=1 Tax=Phyllobacterium sophorae TaxID=1520277 RepID=A0A2P7BFQ4_9HYPH|nr:hypothetical protein [Phyllobacterium sophorae]PSH65303.1 hypothetical protein CU103_09890 [Phyllobacterium sophorae]
MTTFHAHDFVAPPINSSDPSMYETSGQTMSASELADDESALFAAINKRGRLNFAQARSDLSWPPARLACAFARLAARGLVADTSPDSTPRASAWKAQCGAVRSLIGERGWLSTSQVDKVAKAMGVPCPVVACEYLSRIQLIERLPGNSTFYGPVGLPFESQHVVKKVSKPLSLSELRFIEAVEDDCSTPLELAARLNCTRQWIEVIAGGLMCKGYIAGERRGRRIIYSSMARKVSSENRAVTYYELETPGPAQDFRP